jgi:hypothetical protein
VGLEPTEGEHFIGTGCLCAEIYCRAAKLTKLLQNLLIMMMMMMLNNNNYKLTVTNIDAVVLVVVVVVVYELQ